MSEQRYSALVVEHFERPRNAGRLPIAPDVIHGCAGTRTAGALFQLSARVAQDAITQLCFQAYGCPHSVAAASWLSERLIGCGPRDLQQWAWGEVAKALEVPTEKRGRLLILEDAVRALAADWRRRS